MALEIREVEDEKDFNPPAICGTASFTQSFFYGEWQKKAGRKVRRFAVENSGNQIAYFQIIKYSLPFHKSYLYIPRGPVVRSEPENNFLDEFRQKLAEICREEKAIFARFDFYPSQGASSTDKFFTKTPYASYYSAVFQSKFDWALNLEKTEEEILAAMHPKTRYNIRLAEKKGVRVKIIRGQELKNYFETFYKLMVETSRRGKFALHPKRYYEIIFDKSAESDYANLFVAEHGNEILAAYFVVYFGDVAYYPFGGSSALHQNLMPTYLVHWKAIIEAKQKGCKFYNFGAVDAGEKVTHENWEGIIAFKKKFGGGLLEYGDFYDFVARPLWYYLYNLRKKLKFHL